MTYKSEKIALFVDGPNLHATARGLNINIDFSRMRDVFVALGTLRRAHYFTPLAEGEDHVAARPLVDWLAYNGWTVVTTPTKEFVLADGRRRTKGNTDMELAMVAVRLAPSIDHAVLFSGNRDFVPLVRFLQDCGTRVSVVSSLKTDPQIVADDLRRQADGFIDLDDLRDNISRPDRDPKAA